MDKLQIEYTSYVSLFFIKFYLFVKIEYRLILWVMVENNFFNKQTRFKINEMHLWAN